MFTQKMNSSICVLAFILNRSNLCVTIIFINNLVDLDTQLLLQFPQNKNYDGMNGIGKGVP